MPNPYLDQYGAFLEQFAKRVAAHFASLKHSVQKGTVAELALVDLLTSFLPRSLSIKHDLTLVGTGGELSPQCDVGVVDEHSLPRMFPLDGAKLYPVDACPGVFEVKGNLGRKELFSAFANSVKIKSMPYNRVKKYGSFGEEQPAWIWTYPPVHVVWCWRTQASSLKTLVGWMREAMLEYKEYDKGPDVVFFADKGSLYTRTHSLITTPTLPADVYQFATFEIGPGEHPDEEFSVGDGGATLQVSHARAIINALWEIAPRLQRVHQLQKFDPRAYVPGQLRECSFHDLGMLFASDGEVLRRPFGGTAQT